MIKKRLSFAKTRRSWILEQGAVSRQIFSATVFCPRAACLAPMWKATCEIHCSYCWAIPPRHMVWRNMPAVGRGSAGSMEVPWAQFCCKMWGDSLV